MTTSTRRHRRWLAGAVALALVVSGLLLASPTARAFTTVQFDYTGFPMSWTVPPNVFSATFSVFGAEGGSGRDFDECGVFVAGGRGGETIAKLALTPGQKLAIHVGGKGGTPPCWEHVEEPGGAGGFGGGGDGGAVFGTSGPDGLAGGGGGGSSSVSFSGAITPVIVAGGGGGASGGHCQGAPGGGMTADAASCPHGGGGGSQSEGGWGGPGPGGNGEPGAFRQGGDGGGTNTDGVHTYTGGGGGGGGWYGGGGGGGQVPVNGGGGGGGGSNHGPDGSIHIKGINDGHGRIVIVYEFGKPPPDDEEPPPTEGPGLVLCSPKSNPLAPLPQPIDPVPPGGQRTAQQKTTASVCEAEKDPGRPPTPPERGVLGIAVARAAVGFGQIPRGQSSDPAAVGRIYYTNTLGTGNPWSATVAATKLSSGPNAIPFTGMSFFPGSTIEPNSGASGTLTPGTGGKFTGSSANTFSDSMSLMSSPGDAAGSHTHIGSTASLFVPSGTPTKSYTGTLQYTITG